MLDALQGHVQFDFACIKVCCMEFHAVCSFKALATIGMAEMAGMHLSSCISLSHDSEAEESKAKTAKITAVLAFLSLY